MRLSCLVVRRTLYSTSSALDWPTAMTAWVDNLPGSIETISFEGTSKAGERYHDDLVNQLERRLSDLFLLPERTLETLQSGNIADPCLPDIEDDYDREDASDIPYYADVLQLLQDLEAVGVQILDHTGVRWKTERFKAANEVAILEAARERLAIDAFNLQVATQNVKKASAAVSRASHTMSVATSDMSRTASVLSIAHARHAESLKALADLEREAAARKSLLVVDACSLPCSLRPALPAWRTWKRSEKTSGEVAGRLVEGGGRLLRMRLHLRPAIEPLRPTLPPTSSVSTSHVNWLPISCPSATALCHAAVRPADGRHAPKLVRDALAATAARHDPDAQRRHPLDRGHRVWLGRRRRR